jgi:hypothetical protein
MTCDIPSHMSFLFPILNSRRLKYSDLHKWTPHLNLLQVTLHLLTLTSELCVLKFLFVGSVRYLKTKWIKILNQGNLIRLCN